jgi:hypothetical protein
MEIYPIIIIVIFFSVSNRSMGIKGLFTRFHITNRASCEVRPTEGRVNLGGAPEARNRIRPS